VGGFYNIVSIIYLYVVHVIICNPRNSASGCNVVSILIIIIIINKNNNIGDVFTRVLSSSRPVFNWQREPTR
jgi:hypothetical protein